MPSLTWKKTSLEVSINCARNVYEEITKKKYIKKKQGKLQIGKNGVKLWSPTQQPEDDDDDDYDDDDNDDDNNNRLKKYARISPVP